MLKQKTFITLTHAFMLILFMHCGGTAQDTQVIVQEKLTPTNSNQWNREMYNSMDLNTFRSNELFLKTIDFNNIDYPRLHACLFFLTNEIRNFQGRALLTFAPQLEIASYHHSKAMLEEDFFSHQNPMNSARESETQRAKLAGIANPYIAENIAYQGGSIRKGSNYLSAAEVFIKQWMNSSGHRQNILSKDAQQLGCGVYSDGFNWYATQCFQWFQTIQPGPAKDDLP